MNKLFKLKKWLTLKQAIDYISVVLDEPVTEADIYRLALDKHLILSLNLVNGAYVHLGHIREMGLIPIDNDLPCESDFELIPTEAIDNNIFLAGNGAAKLDTDTVVHFLGVWDLLPIGAGRHKLESDYHQLVDNISVKVMTDEIEGVFITDCEEEILGRLLTKKDNDESYSPSLRLDEHDYVLVIRTLELNRFLRALDDSGNLDTVTKTTDSQITFSEKITQTSTWQELYNLADKALEEFPRWQQLQPKPQNIPKSHIDDWLMETLKATKREAETIKKIITEIFNL
jgi:hypothetical protein